MKFGEVFSHMNEFKKSLSKQFEIHVDGNWKILFLDVWYQFLIFFQSPLSLLIGCFITSLFENLFKLRLDVFEINFICSNLSLDVNLTLI